jgi:hypothetical protein
MMRGVTVPSLAADLYLDLLAGCLTRDLFLDEEVLRGNWATGR